MPRLNLTPDGIVRETAAFSRQAAAGLSTLRRLGELAPGVTPREEVWRADGVRLYRYGAATATPRPALLIVYALVNRPEMSDLARGRSLVAGLLERGLDVYLLDWGRPGAADGALGLDDYICRYLDGAVDALRERLRRPAVSLLGICQGGTFALCYAALEPAKVEHLITTVTPVDFHTPDDALAHLVRHIDIDALIAAHGNLSGEWLNALFLSLKPYRLLQQKYVDFVAGLDDAAASALFLRMEKWIFDSPMLSARAAREFARAFYQDNRLMRGELELGGRRVAAGALTMPVLNIYARDDHLVPPAASRALATLLRGGDYAEHELPGGHIGVYVGSRRGPAVASVVAEWLAARGAGAQAERPT